MYSTKEMAEKLGVTAQTLRNWDKTNKLKAGRRPSGRMFYTHKQYLIASDQNKYINDKEDIAAVSDKVVLITGSGTLATCMVKLLQPVCKKIIIYSRDEHKHRKLKAKIANADNIRYIIGDIKDKNKLMSALKNVNICIHTAALKMIETGMYSADEVIKVNTLGTMNVAEVCIERGVEKALFISSDKACNPLNGLTYGLSKSLAEGAWISYNNHSTRDGTILFATRYGNIIDSANSFYDILEEQKKSGKIKVTDLNMSRFYFTIDEAAKLNLHAIKSSFGGEIFIPSLKAAKITTFINAFAKGYPVDITGVRGVEKMHEEMIAQYEMNYTYESIGNSGTKYYKIVPPYINYTNMGWDAHREAVKPIDPFIYTSDKVDLLTEEELISMVKVK